MLAALWRAANRRVVAFVTILALSSFAMSIYGVARGWSAAYYLLPFRTWELLTGSLLALVRIPQITSRPLRELSGLAALLAIVLPTMLLTEDSAFPGANALAPVLGTALLLAVGGMPSQSAVSRMLSNGLIVWLGSISYSLYLWHWPLIVFAKYMTLGHLSTGARMAILFASVGLAWASWRCVEQPFRGAGSIGRRGVFLASFVGIIAAVAAGGVLVRADGFRSRFPDIAQAEQRILAQRAADRATQCVIGEDGRPWRGPQHCWVTHGTGTRILLWGDSHANHLVRALRQLDGTMKGSILVYGMTACAPILDLPSPKRPNCVAAKNRIFDIIKQQRIQRVIIAGYWPPAARNVRKSGGRSLTDTVRRLRAAGVDVGIVGDSPWFYLKEPVFLYARARASGDVNAPLYLPTRNDPRLNAQLRRIAGPDHFFDPQRLLCREDQCLAFDKGEPLFIDEHHLSRFGARRVIEAMGPLID